MADFNQFSKNMQRKAVDHKVLVNKLINTIAKDVLQEIVANTPVDTGRARSNWIVSLGEVPSTATIPPHAPGSKGSTGEENANTAYVLGAAIINQRSDDQSLVISNSLDYIGKLNRGSSVQAPALFVQASVRKAILSISKYKVL